MGERCRGRRRSAAGGSRAVYRSRTGRRAAARPLNTPHRVTYRHTAPHIVTGRATGGRLQETITYHKGHSHSRTPHEPAGARAPCSAPPARALDMPPAPVAMETAEDGLTRPPPECASTWPQAPAPKPDTPHVHSHAVPTTIPTHRTRTVRAYALPLKPLREDISGWDESEFFASGSYTEKTPTLISTSTAATVSLSFGNASTTPTDATNTPDNDPTGGDDPEQYREGAWFLPLGVVVWTFNLA